MEGKEMKKRTISILLAGAMTMAAVMGSTVTALSLIHI